MNHYISASILSADLARLGQECENVLNAGADRIHFDVMDNHYVPNLTFGPLLCLSLKNYLNQQNLSQKVIIDVHLMAIPVDSLIKDFAKAGADIITFHPEASYHVNRSCQLIRDLGCQAGLAFNPATPLSWLDHLSEAIDEILIMSVNPGFGGQSFIKNSLAKISAARQQLPDYVRIAVDGGVKSDNIAQIAHAGANTFIIGSDLFYSPNYQNAIDSYRQQLTQT